MTAPRVALATRLLVVGGAVGALVGLVVGWLLLRPSGGDLVAAAHDLVPGGFAVQGEGLQRGNLLLGWEDIGGVVATDPDVRWDEIAVEEIARAAGWTVVRHQPAAARTLTLLERPGLEADVVVRTEDGDAEVTVMVQRDGSEWLRVATGVLAGAGLGGVVVGVVRRHRTVPS
ncbi:hypothetical protein QUV83_07085 [Cellulomonas cellasea]|uniref:hypothetical protein n=1 Tax=Cellulomonas cellasea TaxID=43670 RepID=UPI0025A3F3F3|nr:hypothetical protein [Cellulomonas cellasea]MDM8084521.1 hypothetical protein [Cellulomonas cellasea]